MRILLSILFALGLVAPRAAGAPPGAPGAKRNLSTIGPAAPGSAEAQRAKLEQRRIALAEGRIPVPSEVPAAASRGTPRMPATPKPPETMTAVPFSGTALEQALRRQQEKIAALALRPRVPTGIGSPGRAWSPGQLERKSAVPPVARPRPAAPLSPEQRAKLMQVPPAAATPAPGHGPGK